MCFGPSTLGAGAKTRLESKIKEFTPHCIHWMYPDERRRSNMASSRSWLLWCDFGRAAGESTCRTLQPTNQKTLAVQIKNGITQHLSNFWPANWYRFRMVGLFCTWLLFVPLRRCGARPSNRTRAHPPHVSTPGPRVITRRPRVSTPGPRVSTRRPHVSTPRLGPETPIKEIK